MKQKYDLLNVGIVSKYKEKFARLTCIYLTVNVLLLYISCGNVDTTCRSISAESKSLFYLPTYRNAGNAHTRF